MFWRLRALASSRSAVASRAAWPASVTSIPIGRSSACPSAAGQDSSVIQIGSRASPYLRITRRA
jgi:hypothetical protein